MTTGTATSEQGAALNFLRTGSGEPWRWSEGGKVLTWTATGGTVVFREELLSILEWLAPHGLPPFPALALLLAACRGYTPSLDDLIGPVEAVRDPSDAAAVKLGALRANLRHRCDEILGLLRDVGGWPRSLLADARVKAMLAETVFDRSDAWVYSPAQAQEIVAGLRNVPPTEEVLNRPTGRRLGYVVALQAVSGLRDVTPATLALRLGTGLDTVVTPASLPPEVFRPPAELARQLLAQLHHDPAHAGLARAARDLLAALSLPRRLPEPDDAAPGGVADMANRGSLDKLLLSELAHDDLTLATRVALNEALYLRNEPPATAKAVSLALLLDAGVRMWGVPRLFAASAALALGAADARRPGLQAWRAAGSKIATVDLLSAAGFQQHLGALATEAHPGPALSAFFAELTRQEAGRAQGTCPEVEAVILTHRDTLADADFRRALDAQCVPPGVELLVATVDRDGHFELRPYPSSGQPSCAVTIRLDEIQRPETPAGETIRVPSPTPLLDPRLPVDLPVILSLPRLPFRLSVRGEMSASCVAPDGRTFAVGKDRCLLSWQETQHGATLLAAGLPPGRTLLLQTEADSGRVHLLKTARRAGRIPLCTYDPATGDVRTVQLAVPGPPPLAARVENGAILLFYRTRADAFRLSDGEKLSSAGAPFGARWNQGRYYLEQTGKERRWSFAAWDGLAGGFSQINGDVQTARVVFDRTGRPGPWMLTGGGEVCHVESRDKVFSFGQPVRPDCRVHVSREGHHLYLSHALPKRGAQCIDLENKRARPYEVSPESLAKKGYEPFLVTPQYPTMSHFSAICVLPSGGLALRSAKGQWREFVWLETGQGGYFGLHGRDAAGMESRARPFVRIKLPGGTPYRLKEARWPDGSRAFLDSRGLLHLKFGQSPVEFSLALTDWHSAVWASDGRMAGADFFLGPDQGKIEWDALLPTLREYCQRIR